MDAKEKQLEELSHIRHLMERSSRFISLSGLSGVSAGLIAIAGALLAWFVLHIDQRYFKPDFYLFQEGSFMKQRLIFLAIDGLAVLILAILAAFWFTWRNARKKGTRIWDPSARRVILNLAIPLSTGGIFCLILGIHGLGWLWAPVLLLFYGLGLINAAKYTFTEVAYLGGAEVLLGLLAAIFPGYGLLFWTAGFGLLHIIYGLYGWNKYEK